MRYCNSCNRVTIGKPLFCNFCGRSYDVKYCPHRHPNPRNADSCSQCGSRDLSTPQPRVSFWLQLLIASFTALPGVLLLLLSVLVTLGLLNVILTNQQLQSQLVLAVLMLALLWYLYTHLPAFLRRLLTKLFHRSNHDDHGR
jgi:hypothetical protein